MKLWPLLFVVLAAMALLLIVGNSIFAFKELNGTKVFHMFGDQLELSHPYYARDFYELSSQHIVVACTNLWDLNQRTNCRVRLWGIGLNGGKPFIAWQLVSMDKDGNWIKEK